MGRSCMRAPFYTRTHALAWWLVVVLEEGQMLATSSKAWKDAKWNRKEEGLAEGLSDQWTDQVQAAILCHQCLHRLTTAADQDWTEACLREVRQRLTSGGRKEGWPSESILEHDLISGWVTPATTDN